MKNHRLIYLSLIGFLGSPIIALSGGVGKLENTQATAEAHCIANVLKSLAKADADAAKVLADSSKNPDYPLFNVDYVSPPSKYAYRSYEETETWDSANQIVRENARYYFNLLRSDPNLAKLSDKELQDGALKAMSWRLEINPQLESLDRMWEGPKISAGAGFDMEKYRLYLKAAGINPDARPPSFQAMLAKFEYKTLAHGTSEEGFFNILRHGKLVSRKVGKQMQQFGDSDGSYIYLEALPKNQDFNRYPNELEEKTPIYLEIDSSVLDQLRWSHLNVYWKFGKYDPRFSIQPTHLLAGFFNILKEVPARNEFLFTDEIPLSYVKGIYIRNWALKDKIINQLKTLGVEQSILDKIH